MKLELLTNASIVEDALKFVDRNKNNKVQNNDLNTIVNEPIETF